MAADRYTRCPHCASVFRLEAEQLQQAQGWLRCGQCAHAFDATGRVVLCGDAPDALPQGPRLELESLLRREDTGQSVQQVQEDHAPPVAPLVPATPALGDELLAFERALASFPVPAPVASPLLPPLGDELPAWVPEADLPLRPPRRAARRWTWAWAWLLVLLLLVQAVWATRVQWAVHWPVWGRWAQAACDRLGCVWRPWHVPGVLRLEHANLSRSVHGHRLQWVLHNQASWPAAMPSLELSLVDGHEQVLTRRVLSPAELQAPPVMAPLAHWSGEVHWPWPDDQPVAGYRLLVFYP